MSEQFDGQAADRGARAIDLELVPEPVPIEANRAPKPLKYEAHIQEFWESGLPSARLRVTWSAPSASEKAKLERARNLVTAMKKVANRLGLPVSAVARGAEVYLVRRDG